jgi:hypothetical protein
VAARSDAKVLLALRSLVAEYNREPLVGARHRAERAGKTTDLTSSILTPEPRRTGALGS